MGATRDDVVLQAVRLALGTAPRPPDISAIDAELISRAAELGVVDQVIAAGRIIGFAAEGESTAAAAARARSLRGTQSEAAAWRVHRILSDADVASLVLKGAALAVMTRRSAGERPGVDTDVLVRPLDWPRAHDALVAAGYTLDTRVPPPRRRDSLTQFITFSCYEATYAGPGGPVDLHWRLVPGHSARISAPRLFARSVEVELAGGTVATLDPDAMLAHVALHGAKDHWRSWRTLVDAYLLLVVAGAEWDGAAALVGSSRVVSDAKAAVESVIIGTGASATVRVDAAHEPESLPSFLMRRARLTPSVSSTAAVAAGMLLPRQILAQGRWPRHLWWLAVVPRVGRAVRWCFRSAVRDPGVHSDPNATNVERSASPKQLSRSRRYAGHAHDIAHDLASWFGGTPSRAATYTAARKVHMRTAGVSSAAVLAVMRALPGAPDHVERLERVRARDRSGSAVGELRQYGLAVVEPVLDSTQLEHVREFARLAPAKLRLADGRVIDGTYADRHPDTVSVAIPGAFAWANGQVQHVMSCARLHDLALARCGVAPVVHTPTLNWSCVPATSHDRCVGQQFDRITRFHVDYDGVQAIRVHMYLTDVDEGTAPMQYVAGSHRVGSLRGRALRTADRGVDERAVIQRFGAGATRTITGPAGTTFVTDPRGLHRATTPVAGDRLFLAMAIRGGAFAGAVHRKRALPVRDEDFDRLLTVPHGPLRLFEAIPTDGSSTAPPVRVARLA